MAADTSPYSDSDYENGMKYELPSPVKTDKQSWSSEGNPFEEEFIEDLKVDGDPPKPDAGTSSSLPSHLRLLPLHNNVNGIALYPILEELHPRLATHLRILIQDGAGIWQLCQTLKWAYPDAMDVFIHARYFNYDGRLSHLAVNVASQNTTFLLDLLSLDDKDALSHSAWLAFGKMLEDPSIKVCCFDACRDAFALKRLGITIRGVVDMKAFQDDPLLPLTWPERRERLQVIKSAAAVVVKHGVDAFNQRPLPSETQEPWHHFLAFDVAYMPRFYAFQIRDFQQLSSANQERKRHSQVLEKSEAHTAECAERGSEWGVFLGHFSTATRCRLRRWLRRG